MPLAPRCAVRCLVLWFVVCLAPSASATRVVAMDLDELVARSPLVLRGRVLHQAPAWDASRRRIYTDSTVLVDEVLRGRAAFGVVTVRQLGGTLGGVTQEVDGTGRLTPGADVVLFLNTDGALHYVVGMAQGRFNLVSRQGRVWVVRDLDGARLVGPAVGWTPRPLSYAEFAARVRRLAAGGR